MLVWSFYLSLAKACSKNENPPPEEECPDKDLQEECNKNCQIELTGCRLLCESDYCLSVCVNTNDNCLNECPCAERCPDGCTNCDHPLCADPTPAETYIMVLRYTFADYYYYTYESYDSELMEEGTYDHRLYNPYIISGDGSKMVEATLVCFEYSSPSIACNIFDGSQTTKTYSTSYGHYYGGLGLYNGQPTTVGSGPNKILRNVETLTPTGWIELEEYPVAQYGHSLIGLDDGSMLAFGGFSKDGFWESVSEIRRLKDNKWTLVGNLLEKTSKASVLKSGSSIYLVSGDDKNAPTQRIDLDGNEISNITVIAYQPQGAVERPVLFETTFDRCV
ncbi:Oidioi.mRNA.OKI2018_I69.chr2.g7221.t1.cds [Oikopleura dioica]|uniref:Oidioi.mRNA.OKI2018_I69.chr2.g7221.t1.cds n=1 Tax=Oikopleura dioica TaxID=34765 RepID=A0ABN7T5H1_OIKDI|nr:Oidioi.mRNA.OKI2018_I69.chr2.g7221.t1.cds [Oikopleura dioica]